MVDKMQAWLGRELLGQAAEVGLFAQETKACFHGPKELEQLEVPIDNSPLKQLPCRRNDNRVRK